MTFKLKHIVVCIFICVTVLNAQTKNESSHLLSIFIPEVALLSIQSSIGTNITFKGKADTDTGKSILFNEKNNSIWINYSSIIGSKADPYRVVTVQISDGKIPRGLNLYVKAGNDVSQGGGNMGNPLNEKEKLSHNPLIIIKYIGSAYTGVGENKGHNIEYTLEMANNKQDYDKLKFDQSEPLTITYTLSDN